MITNFSEVEFILQVMMDIKKRFLINQHLIH